MLVVENASTGAPDDEIRVAPQDVYSPVAAGESLPAGFFQVLPRDFIAPVYEPEFVDAPTAGWPDDTDVIGVVLGGEAKAYPISLLNSREMVVDRIADVPILVTWCPLCGTALVHRREVNGETLTFGVQGALFMNAMTWWDHTTGSIWSQPLGRGDRRSARRRDRRTVPIGVHHVGIVARGQSRHAGPRRAGRTDGVRPA